MHDCRRVVPRVDALAGGIGEDRSAQLVVVIEIRAPHPFVHHVGHAHRRIRPAYVHADFHERDHDAGILAHRTVSLGAQARVGQDLRHRVLSRGRLLERIGASQRVDVIERVVVGDVLQRVGDALHQVFLPDRGHG